MSKTYRHVARKKTDTLLWLQINNLLPQVLGKFNCFLSYFVVIIELKWAIELAQSCHDLHKGTN